MWTMIYEYACRGPVKKKTYILKQFCIFWFFHDIMEFRCTRLCYLTIIEMLDAFCLPPCTPLVQRKKTLWWYMACAKLCVVQTRTEWITIFMKMLIGSNWYHREHNITSAITWLALPTATRPVCSYIRVSLCYEHVLTTTNATQFTNTD